MNRTDQMHRHVSGTPKPQPSTKLRGAQNGVERLLMFAGCPSQFSNALGIMFHAIDCSTHPKLDLCDDPWCSDLERFQLW